jgi:beta-lactamase class D
MRARMSGKGTREAQCAVCEEGEDGEAEPMKLIVSVAILASLAGCAQTGDGREFPIPEKRVQEAFADRAGGLVVVDCLSGNVSRFHPEVCSSKYPPCSTFKIWNTLIGLECGLLSSADDAFYKWDGKARFIPEWNKDLALKQAFQVSCVPAFQELARNIGPNKMRLWIDKIGYGDRNISAGIDVFWLPAPGRRTLLISPDEQAGLMCTLASGRLPVSDKSQAVLKGIMAIRKTDRGTLYGKTGTGHDDAGQCDIGWFVGYVDSSGRKYAFACIAKGENTTGKNARAIVETILMKQRLL